MSRTSRDLPSRRTIQLRVVAVLGSAILATGAAMATLLYRATVLRVEEDLGHTADAVAALADATYRAEVARDDDSTAARRRAIQTLSDAALRFRDLGATGELVVGEPRGDSIYFLVPERNSGGGIPLPVALGDLRSVQLQAAVRGESGVVSGLDYRGIRVVGAFRPIPELGAGLVAKMDAAEVRAPLLRALGLTFLLAAVILLVAVRLISRTVTPLLTRVFGHASALEGDLLVAGASVERYAALFRASSDPVVIEDLEGRVLEANPAAAATFGRPVDALIGLEASTLFPEDEPTRLATLRRRCAAGEEVRDDRRTARGADGSRVHLLVSLTAVRDHTGTVTGVASIAKDISALEDARAVLATQNELLDSEVKARTAALEQELRVARALAAETRRGQDTPLLGDSAAIRGLRERIVEMAALEDPVLLAGPIGAGQEATARAMHQRSARQGAPFLVLDCSIPVAIDTPAGGVGGDRGGSLTSILAAAAGGTLYLHQLDQLEAGPQEQLVALLTAPATPEAPRFIASVHGDLGAVATSGQLHPALVKAFTRRRVTVPALIERGEDVIAIATRALDDAARQHGRPPMTFSERAHDRLREHAWPGNVRELLQVVESLVRSTHGTVIDIEEPLGGAVRSVGGYRLTAPLGHGGMGEVWRAEHALLKRPAAVKLLRRRGELSPADRAMLDARFRREAEVTARLNSPHTVQLFDFGVTGEGEYYYVMELLQGMSLADLIRVDRGLPANRCVYLLQQACRSLAEAHALGLVHRDLKPDNLFICRWIADADFLKVLDFGIVRVTEERGTSSTQTGFVMGTPAYMAPEVAKGEPATAAADMYALGCVLFKMLTGRAVFEVEGGQMQQMVAHMEQEPVAPSTVASRPVSPELDALVLRLLSKRPADRPQTAMQLHDLLATLPVGRPWTADDAREWWRERDDVTEALRVP